MRRWGCLGTSIGAAIGLLVVLLLVVITQPAPPQSSPPSAALPPDATIFISERSLSRIATERLGQPTLIDVDPHEQIRVTTHAPLWQFQALAEVALQLEMEGSQVASRLRWIKMGFLVIPARWLPAPLLEAAEVAGQGIAGQMPPEFRLIGVSTTPDGVNFQLKWVGR